MTQVANAKTSFVPTSTIRLEGVIRTLSPLQHFWRQEKPDGKSLVLACMKTKLPLDENPAAIIPYYSGNALRGILRDALATQIVSKVGPLPKDTFQLLYSGGRIDKIKENGGNNGNGSEEGGEEASSAAKKKGKKVAQATAEDTENRITPENERRLRERNVVVGLLGGGLGKRIISGRLNVMQAWPICSATVEAGLIPDRIRQMAGMEDDEKLMNPGDLVTEFQMTRFDDLRRRPSEFALDKNEELKVMGAAVDKDNKDDGRGMVFTVEAIAAGVSLCSQLYLVNTNDAEVGALLAAIERFGNAPFLGGSSSAGFGLVDMTYDLCENGTRVKEAIKIQAGSVQIDPSLDRYRQAFNAYLDKVSLEDFAPKLS